MTRSVNVRIFEKRLGEIIPGIEGLIYQIKCMNILMFILSIDVEKQAWN